MLTTASATESTRSARLNGRAWAKAGDAEASTSGAPANKETITTATVRRELRSALEIPLASFIGSSSKWCSQESRRRRRKNLVQQHAGGPDDRDAEQSRRQAYAAQFRRILARRRRHALSHRICKPRHQQSLDREDEPDRGAEVAHLCQSAFAAAGGAAVVG